MMKARIIFFFVVTVIALSATTTAKAQQYKLRQVSVMSTMKTETTIYVKGPRKRTEGGGYMGMTSNIVTIEQCDLQRTVKFNDKKKLYFIAPFRKDDDEEDPKEIKPVKKTVPAAAKEKTTQPHGTITTWSNITDTGERKKMFGLTARHVWTTQKIKPSADACMMKDSMLIKTDGWYIDLPQFNCTVSYGGKSGGYGGYQKPDCQDKFISKRSGKGKLGFPLIETKTMIMGGTMQSNEFTTSLETLELSTVKLDSMLFEIPPGYTLTENEEDLQDKMGVAEMMKQSANMSNERPEQTKVVTEKKASGVTRIGVYEPTSDDQLPRPELQKHLVNMLADDKVESVAITSIEDAKKYHCDYILNTEFTKVKQGSKVASFLKAIKNADPSSSSFNIEANFTLARITDGSTHLQQKVNGKYDGKIDEAAKKTLDKGSESILKKL